jgi:aerobic carbon-monoxide dehydrogenase medium subunit
VSLTSVEEYFTPDDENQVHELLRKYGDGALIVAGGSFVHGLDARNLLTSIVALVDLQNLRLNEISRGPDGLTIGATVTLAALQQSGHIVQSPAFGAVQDALCYPPVQIRNVATVGGNIAAACPYFDLPTAFMALGARVETRGPEGSRSVDLQEFFAGLFQNTLKAEEYVSALLLPPLSAGSASAFIKLETNANDLAIVNAAACVSLDDAGVCEDARVVVGGGVAETPVRATESEALLRGEKPSEDVLRHAGAAARAGLEPMSDHRASGAYRTAMAEVLTVRALKRAIGRLTASAQQ